jgi:hypothetical protein
MSGAQLVIMGIVTFAMVFSSLGLILAYGGREAAIITIVVFAVIIAGVFLWSRLRNKGDEKIS